MTALRAQLKAERDKFSKFESQWKGEAEEALQQKDWECLSRLVQFAEACRDYIGIDDDGDFYKKVGEVKEIYAQVKQANFEFAPTEQGKAMKNMMDTFLRQMEEDEEDD